MRTVPVRHRSFGGRTVLRVVELEKLPGEWRPDLKFAVRVSSEGDARSLANVIDGGVHNLVALTREESVFRSSARSGILEVDGLLQSGDVIALTSGLDYARVVFRESDLHHTIFLTNRCNSNCLMCSQPPTRHADSWLVEEAIEIAAHIRVSPETIGFTGGEPLLLGAHLRSILNRFHEEHAEAHLEVLTNGRRFSEASLAETLLANLGSHVTWMVPLYGHADFLHDYVVQAPGTFNETIGGLLNLRAYGQAIQLRTVLH